jgi:hypothetical protein
MTGMTISETQTGIPRARIFPAGYSSRIKRMAGTIRIRQTEAEKRWIMTPMVDRTLGDRRPERISMDMCRFCRVATEAPSRAIQSTRWRKRGSIQYRLMDRRFRKRICSRPRRTIAERSDPRAISSSLLKKEATLFQNKGEAGITFLFARFLKRL